MTDTNPKQDQLSCPNQVLAAESEIQSALCKQCRNPIPSSARICSKCNSYQDWRSFVPFSTTALALLTALISVMGIAAPALHKLVHTPHSQAALTMPSVDGTTLRVIAVNSGDAPASLIRAWVDSDYLAAATKVRLRNDADAIIQPGNKLLTFDVVPLLDEDDSYRSSLEMLSYIIQKKPGPRTEVRFHILQSDGRFAIQAVPLDAGELFALLRANADRCSAIATINFENGCIGRGTPPEERFPTASDNMPKGLADELETRINRQREAAAETK
ncbi:hypothetical protein [Pseudomonas sp. PDM30]|uniref:hypothetical protein n=1 Tax=Pseudomonas sp. PDM30 TaxID=2854773 RepID=UPI001C468F64|nr:hypothetical protein [Pseudomonas sp. PDM30]MBV7489597.1 hypothetical protein [Pseudomonas sp. PDM30]